MQTLVTQPSVPQAAYDQVLQDARRRLGANAVAALTLLYASPTPLSSAVIQAGTGMTRTHTSVVLLRLAEKHYILKLDRGQWQRHPDLLTLFPVPGHQPAPAEAEEPVSMQLRLLFLLKHFLSSWYPLTMAQLEELSGRHRTPLLADLRWLTEQGFLERNDNETWALIKMHLPQSFKLESER